MNNKDMPAMPCSQTIDRENNEIVPHQFGNDDFVVPGLSKREYYAIMALQGILTNPEGQRSDQAAVTARLYADALLDELERTQE